jgi:hypothetical protein
VAGHACGGVERLEDVPAAAGQAAHVAGGVDHLERPALGDGPDAGGGVEAYRGLPGAVIDAEAAAGEGRTVDGPARLLGAAGVDDPEGTDQIQRMVMARQLPKG